MKPTNYPRPAHLAAAERLASERRTAELAAEEREAQRREAEAAKKQAEQDRGNEAAVADLNRTRDGVWNAPLPKTLAGFAGIADRVTEAIATYRATANGIGTPVWEQNAVIQAHRVMALMPWLATFGPAKSNG